LLKDGAGEKKKSALVVIDMSVEQWAGIEYRREDTVQVIQSLMHLSPSLKPTNLKPDPNPNPSPTPKNFTFDLIIDSHLSMKCAPDSFREETPKMESTTTPSRNVISESTLCGITASGREGSKEAEILPQLAKIPNVQFIEKKQFSCFYGSSLDAALRGAGIEMLFVVGINTNYCVFATVLDGWERGYEMGVVVDGVTSCDGSEGHERGMQMLRSFFGESDRVHFLNSTDLLEW